MLAIFSKWTSASLRRAAVAGGVLVGPGSIALVVLGTRLSEAYDQSITDFRESSRTVRLLELSVGLLVDGETSQRGFLLTGNPVFLEPLDASRTKLHRVLVELDAMYESRGQSKFFDHFERATLNRVDYTNRVIELARAGKRDQALLLVESLQGKRLMDGVRSLVDDAVTRETKRFDASIGEIADLRLRIQLTFAGFVVLGSGVGLVFFLAVRAQFRVLEEERVRSREEARRFSALAETSKDLVRVHRIDGTLEYVNAASLPLLGHSPEEMKALPVEQLIAPTDLARVRERISRAVSGDVDHAPLVHFLMHKNGSPRLFETLFEFMHDESGRVARFSTLSRDITDKQAKEESLLVRAERDELTGLYNRRTFLERGAELLERCRAEKKNALLAFCDVDGLKRINDSAGHELGDRLIREAGQLLAETARETDLVARLGGDEFVVLGLVRDPSGGDAFRGRLEDRIESYNAESRRSFRVAMSVGTAVFVAPYEKTLQELLLEADERMYEEKKARRAALPLGLLPDGRS